MSGSSLPTPPPMHNTGNYIDSLGNVVRWLGEQAEAVVTEGHFGAFRRLISLGGSCKCGAKRAAAGSQRTDIGHDSSL